MLVCINNSQGSLRRANAVMLLRWDRGTVGTFRRVHCKPSTERSDIQAISRNREPSRNWRRNLPLSLLLLLLLLFPERQHFQFQLRFQFQRELPIPMRATRNKSRRRTMTKSKTNTKTKMKAKTMTRTYCTHTHAHSRKRAHSRTFLDWYYPRRGVCNPGTAN